MTKEKEIDQFKRELRSYRNWKENIKNIELKIEELETKMINVKSPNLEAVKCGCQCDNIKLILIEKKIEYEKKKNMYESYVNYIDECMSKLTKEEKDILLLVYMEHVPIRKIAKTYYMSEASVFRWIDRIIMKAIHEN